MPYNNTPLSPTEIGAQLRTPSGEVGNQFAVQMNQSNALINQACIAALQCSQASPRLLEIGPGNAGFLETLQQRFEGLHYTGLDWSQDMVALAQQQHARQIEAGRARFLQGSAHAMPFESGHFDFILSVHTLYFWPDLQETLREILRVLKPAGQLVLGFGDKQFMTRMPFTAEGFKLYTLEELTRALNTLGLRHIQHSEHREEGQNNAGDWVEKHVHCLHGRKAGA